MKKLNIGMIGYKFMGKAHSNAWIKANKFFTIGAEPIRKVVCGRNYEQVNAFAKKWEWEEAQTDWKTVIYRNDIDIIDVCAPPHLHYDIGLATLKALGMRRLQQYC